MHIERKRKNEPRCTCRTLGAREWREDLAAWFFQSRGWPIFWRLRHFSSTSSSAPPSSSSSSSAGDASSVVSFPLRRFTISLFIHIQWVSLTHSPFCLCSLRLTFSLCLFFSHSSSSPANAHERSSIPRSRGNAPRQYVDPDRSFAVLLLRTFSWRWSRTRCRYSLSHSSLLHHRLLLYSPLLLFHIDAIVVSQALSLSLSLALRLCVLYFLSLSPRNKATRKIGWGYERDRPRISITRRAEKLIGRARAAAHTRVFFTRSFAPRPRASVMRAKIFTTNCS